MVGSNLGEGKTLVFIVGFSLLFVIIVSLMPAGLVTENYGDFSTEPPTYFSGIELGAYAETTNFSLTDAVFTNEIVGGRYYDFDLGGRTWYMFIDSQRSYIVFGIRTYTFLFLTSRDPLIFKNVEGIDRGTSLTIGEMNQDFTGNEGYLTYRVYLERDTSIGCEVNLGFNTTLYASPQDAYENDGLRVLVGMGYDDTNTALNIWSFIGALLYFSFPNVHPLVNIMGRGIFFLGFGYAIARFLLRLLPWG